ncbi:MAG: hypothetical protein H6815_00350 [Phycisphaeraceae bacterium]|nr:hypothetical protein [Phycisphaerales bacterium]MCB9858874.1 hypothetical protein [Phycisphaeraceae bacterium]
MVAHAKVPLSAHPLDYAATDHVWTCPETGIEVPKDPLENLRSRKRTLDLIEADEHALAYVIELCRKSPLLFFNLFLWTYRQQYVEPDGHTRSAEPDEMHVPFITWPVQDTAILRIVDRIRNGGDIGIDKSRDMGASWICAAVFFWFWMFEPGSLFLIIARIEDDVDKKAYPKSLFWKLDYLYKNLPPSMRPTIGRSHMTFENKDNGAVISGSATSGDAGRGDRIRAALIDEASSIRVLDEIIRALHGATPCRIYNSTAKGPTAFARLRYSGTIPFIIMPWWDHPNKGIGRELVQLEDGTRKWTSPFYRYEDAVRTRREIAQNLDMNHGAAGDMVIDPEVLSIHRATYTREPVWRGLVVLPTLESEHETFFTKKLARPTLRTNREGNLKLWIDPHKVGRRSDSDFTIGIDVCGGVGQSNSTINVMNADTGEVVAELACNEIKPYELAQIAVLLGRWFGSARGKGREALIIFENNGLGSTVGDEIVRCGYHRIYLDKPTGTRDTKQTSRYGWSSNNKTKIEVFEFLEMCLKRHECSTPSEMCIAECETYVWYERGGTGGTPTIGPGHLEDAPSNEKSSHGDRSIAFALANWARRSAPKTRAKEIDPPVGSQRWREKQLEVSSSLDDLESDAV